MSGLQNEHEGGEERTWPDSECASTDWSCCAIGSHCYQRVRASSEGVYVGRA
jgi:hypothetical protein